MQGQAVEDQEYQTVSQNVLHLDKFMNYVIITLEKYEENIFSH